MPTTTLSVDQLKRAIAIAEQIEQLQSSLAAVLGGSAPTPASSPAPAVSVPKGRKKRKMSPEGRARIIAAVKARWARSKGAKSVSAAAPTTTKRKKKRNLTPEGRARLAASMKARWAARKAAAKTK